MNDRLLEKVCNIPGIPGFEDPIQEFVMQNLQPICDKVHVSNQRFAPRIGNVIGLKKAIKPLNYDKDVIVVTTSVV